MWSHLDCLPDHWSEVHDGLDVHVKILFKLVLRIYQNTLLYIDSQANNNQ